MLIWFVAWSVVLVAIVFRSPAIDYRTVVVGALLPLVEVVLGGPRLLHSVVGAVGVLVAVVLATPRRRLLRRRLLGVPIGLMCHLVLDGSFTRTDVFWWPMGGWAFAPGQIPELSHLGVSLVLEAIGIAVAVWAWRLFRLGEPAVRQRFVDDGRLELPT
jgi:hypothetical protein